jgi:membrane protein implicated in regulation of membrane protease activity
VSFIDLHVVFLLIGLLLLVVEVVMGMTLGIALSGAITFFILGLVTWMNLVSGLNDYLIVGVIIFMITTVLVLRYFRSRVQKKQSARDVNDY